MKIISFTFLLLSFAFSAIAQIKIDVPVKAEYSTYRPNVDFLDDGGLEVTIEAGRYIYDAEGKLLPKPAKEEYLDSDNSVKTSEKEYALNINKKSSSIKIRDRGTYKVVELPVELEVSRYYKISGGEVNGKVYFFVFDNLLNVSKKKLAVTIIELGKDLSIKTDKVIVDFLPEGENKAIVEIQYMGEANGKHLMAFTCAPAIYNYAKNLYYASFNSESVQVKKMPIDIPENAIVTCEMLEAIDEPAKFFSYQRTFVEIPKNDREQKQLSKRIKYVIYEIDEELNLESYSIEIPSDVVTAYSVAGATYIPELTTFKIGNQRNYSFSVKETTFLLTEEEGEIEMKTLNEFYPGNAASTLILLQEDSDIINAAIIKPYAKSEYLYTYEDFHDSYTFVQLNNKNEISKIAYLHVMMNGQKKIGKARILYYTF